jgi:hypothetical protein
MWVLNDARWFLKSAMELGFDTAMKLDLEVVKSFAKTEMKRFLSETGFGQIKNIEQFKQLFEMIANLYFPEEHKYEIKILDDHSLLGRVLECYVYKAVSKAGVTAAYNCAAKTRFESWLESCELDGEIIADKNTNDCGGTCNIVFRIHW